MIVGGGGNTLGGSSDSTANYGGSIIGSNGCQNNAYYSAIVGAYAPSGAFSIIRRGVDVNNGIAGAFIGQTIFVVGGVGAFITGAWVPIGMGVLVVEVFLILESRYSEVKLENNKQEVKRYKM